MKPGWKLLAKVVASFLVFAAGLPAGKAQGRGPGAAAPAPAAPRPPTESERARYPWLPEGVAVRTLAGVFAPPPGFARVSVADGSFGAWLRGLPLRPFGAEVRSYDGRVICAAGDPRVAAVAELDVGSRDRQQCADSIIRLHAEWLWSAGRAEGVAYLLTGGGQAIWRRYAAGDRARAVGRKLVWSRGARADGTHQAFRRYLDLVFTYASTRSLAREGRQVDRRDVTPGDFFVMPGGPGHAVLVLDVAAAPDGRRVALVGQGFMPAQDFHVLAAADGSPWFSLDGELVATPFWLPFPWASLRRF